LSQISGSRAKARQASHPPHSLFVMQGLEHSGLAHAAVYSVVGTVRTVPRKRRSATRLTRAEAQPPRLLDLYAGVHVGRLWLACDAMRLLATPYRALAGTGPLQILGCDAVAIAVDEMLSRIEHGMTS